MKKVDQYPSGTDRLWMAHYSSTPHSGDMNGMAVKIDGTAEEAMVEAQKVAVEYNETLQCIRRRY